MWCVSQGTAAFDACCVSPSFTLLQLRDVAAVASVTSSYGVPLKVILETCLLSTEEVTAVSAGCRLLGVAWIKTSTGFTTGGATTEAVVNMHEQGSGDHCEFPISRVKASGGIKTLVDTLKMINAG
jgi:deoxyribose-phosphate aldolase